MPSALNRASWRGVLHMSSSACWGDSVRSDLFRKQRCIKPYAGNSSSNSSSKLDTPSVVSSTTVTCSNRKRPVSLLDHHKWWYGGINNITHTNTPICGNNTCICTHSGTHHWILHSVFVKHLASFKLILNEFNVDLMFYSFNYHWLPWHLQAIHWTKHSHPTMNVS